MLLWCISAFHISVSSAKFITLCPFHFSYLLNSGPAASHSLAHAHTHTRARANTLPLHRQEVVTCWSSHTHTHTCKDRDTSPEEGSAGGHGDHCKGQSEVTMLPRQQRQESFSGQTSVQVSGWSNAESWDLTVHTLKQRETHYLFLSHTPLVCRLDTHTHKHTSSSPFFSALPSNLSYLLHKRVVITHGMSLFLSHTNYKVR